MEKRVLVSTFQKVSREDFNKLGTFPETSLDTIVGKTLIPDMAYDGFGVTQSGPAEVTVAIGHLYALGKVYVNDTDGGTVINLLSQLPAATRRIVTIAAWGSELDAKLEPRTFLTDAETRAVVSRETSTEHWRWANIGPVSGIEGPDPQPKELADNVLALAYVTLTTVGVVDVKMATENLVPTLREADNRLNAYDIWKITVGTRLDTLASDLLALAARMAGLAKWDFVSRMVGDLALVKDQLRIPAAYVQWAADHFLTFSGSQPTDSRYHAKVDEGVRFPDVATSDSQLGLLNPLEPLAINSSDVLLPAWVPMTRITQHGSDLQMSIATYQYQTVAMVQKTLTRYRLRYGTQFYMCSNGVWWNLNDLGANNFPTTTRGAYGGFVDYATATFYRNTGETYNILSITQDGVWAPGHTMMRLQQYWTDEIKVAYWDATIVPHTVAGAILAQTFVNSQDGWLCSVDLFFSQVASTGTVYMAITETTNGAPDLNKVIAFSSIDPVDIHQSPAGTNVKTTIQVTPTFLGKERYAVVLVTGGNHFLWALQDTNYVSGSLFYSTDLGWFQGDLGKDLAFDLNFCSFTSNQSRIQLNPLQLTNGIASIDINARLYIPDGCQLFWEVQKSGIWYALDGVSGGGAAALFVGLPPILPFRVVFIGTQWVQPALGVASNSRVECARPDDEMTHISATRTMPVAAPITNISCDIRLENWRGGPDHTFDLKLLRASGGGDTDFTASTDPTSMSEVIAPDDADAVIRTYTWSGLSSTAEFRFRMDGTTSNILTLYHVAERIDIDTA